MGRIATPRTTRTRTATARTTRITRTRTRKAGCSGPEEGGEKPTGCFCVLVCEVWHGVVTRYPCGGCVGRAPWVWRQQRAGNILAFYNCIVCVWIVPNIKY